MKPMNKYIGKKDKTGCKIRNLDLIAESEIGKIIWDGEGEVVERPIGQVYRWSKGFNVKLVKCGKVKLFDPENEKNLRMWGGSEFVDLYLSCYDGEFYGWDNVEIVPYKDVDSSI